MQGSSKSQLAAIVLVLLWTGGPLGAEAEEVALPSVLELQRAYLEANGGRANLETIQSLRVSGRIEAADGPTLPFKIFRKRPALMRLITDYPGHSIESISDGESVKQRLVYPDGRSERIELKDSVRQRLLHDSQVDGPFYQLRGREDLVEVEAFETVGEREAVRLSIDPKTGLPYSKLWLDRENFQEIKLRSLSVAEDGSELATEVYFDDFSPISGVWFPRKITYFVNGDFFSKVRIEEVSLNVGLFDSYFRVD